MLEAQFDKCYLELIDMGDLRELNGYLLVFNKNSMLHHSILTGFC
jgi:hypothetical protein